MAVEDGLRCVWASDVAPKDEDSPVRIKPRDALSITAEELRAAGARMVITNPPWTREVMHPIIEHFLGICPQWMLFDADWMHNKSSSKLIMRCARIVPIGRVKWFPDSPHTGVDNVAWYFFPTGHNAGPTFAPRN